MAKKKSEVKKITRREFIAGGGRRSRFWRGIQPGRLYTRCH